jgi:MFS family permease
MLMVLLIGQQPAWTGIGIGLTAAAAAWLKVPSGLVGFVGSPWSGHVAARSGARRAAILGSAVTCVGWVIFALWHDSVAQLVTASVVCTLGGSALYAAMPNLIVEVAPPERTAEFNGMSHVFRTLGTAVGTQIVTMLLATATAVAPDGAVTKHPAPSAFMLAFVAINGMVAAMLLVALLLPRRAAAQRATSPDALSAPAR